MLSKYRTSPSPEAADFAKAFEVSEGGLAPDTEQDGSTCTLASFASVVRAYIEEQCTGFVCILDKVRYSFRSFRVALLGGNPSSALP